MNQYIIPQPLKAGDKAVIISPSGSIDSLYVNKAQSVLEKWGLQVKIAPHAQNCTGRFCGTIEERLTDIQTAMDDYNNRMIFCSRGGCGAVHLLDKLNWKKIKQHPKWFVGYSDITALHQAFLKNKLASLHAPMAKHLSENSTDKASMYLKKALFGEIPHYTVNAHPLNIKGTAEGILFGGNLAVFSSLLASNYINVPQGGILFIEDIGEQAYQIDRMIWSLKLSGIFDQIKGIVVGSFTNCEEDPLMYSSIYESIKNIVKEYGIVASFGFPVGHSHENYPLLHGQKMKLHVSNTKVELSESM